MENEIWKDITGYEGLYQVSNMGRVRSTNRTIKLASGSERRLPSKVLRPGNQRGYLRVTLSSGGIETTHLVHRLVAAAFMGPAADGMEVDHINEDHGDNRLDNLRYLSRFENASRSTLGYFRKGSNSMENNPRTKRVIGVKDGVIVDVLPCAKCLSKKHGVNYSTLRGRLQRGGILIDKILYRYETTT
jgi:hypothetical protein